MTNTRRSRQRKKTWTRWMGGGIAAGGAAWFFGISLGPSSQEEVNPAWLEAAVASVQFSDAERHYEKVLFSEDILETRDLAREAGRPILMFSNDGPLGRC
jgi:hypothetical protein